MDRDELEQQIEHELRQSERKVLNRNAFNALFGAFSDPMGSLGRIFLGREDALSAEKQRIEQGYVLDLLCAIDSALTDIRDKADEQGILINGLIETKVERADSVTGAHIGSNVKNVRIQQGANIKTDVGVAKTVTGLKIGD